MNVRVCNCILVKHVDPAVHGHDKIKSCEAEMINNWFTTKLINCLYIYVILGTKSRT
jgi:hypothetical protein